jgi:hypothetical protein
MRQQARLVERTAQAATRKVLGLLERRVLELRQHQ